MPSSTWEHADLKLPAVEFARFRQAVAKRELDHQQSLFEHSQNFWRQLTAKQKTDREAYEAAFEQYELTHTFTNALAAGAPTSPDALITLLPEGLGDFVKARRHVGYDDAPARVQKDDVDFANNRTTTFQTNDGSATLTFVKSISTVQWSVTEGLDAVTVARASRLGESFYSHLPTIGWTRGTGGVVYGGDSERDNGEFGGISSLVTDGYGPVGATQAPDYTNDYTMSDGTVVTADDFPAAVKAAKFRAKHARRAAKHLSKTGAKAHDFGAPRTPDNRSNARPSVGAAVGSQSQSAAHQQGRLGAGNGARSGEWTAKDQSPSEIHLAAHV